MSLSCKKFIIKYGQSFIYNKFSGRLRQYAHRKTYINVSKHTMFTDQGSHISTMPVVCAKAAHTTKGWKFIARDGKRLDPKAKILVGKCEEGNDAVPHTEVIAKLQSCSSVASQIETFSSLLSLTPEDLERRKAFCQSFHEAFKIYFPHFKVHLFGSSINGLGFKGCDADVCLQVNFGDEDFLLLKELPTLKSVRDGTVSKDTISRMNPLFMLRFVRRILREHCPDIKEPILLVKARCPVLRFYNAKYDLFCDLSCENKFSLQNTKLLHLTCNLDPRFVQLAKIIRYWGKYGGFVGDIDQFNSYSFSLLVLHFLQVLQPPILSPVSEMLNKSAYLREGDMDNKDMLLKDLQNFSPSKNALTVEELLKKFFFYYLSYDFSRIMQPFGSTSIHKSKFMLPVKDAEDIFEFNSVSIQDPFRPSFNATGAASFRSCKRFLHGILQACTIYQNDSLWVPQTEMWGICSIFQKQLSEAKISEIWHQNNIHTLQMAARPEAVEKLKKIFEYGLLFHCKEFHLSEDLHIESNSKPLVKLKCTSYVNTWQGRNLYSQNFQDNEKHPLEVEHSISTEMSTNSENKKQILCEFLCECSEICENNQTKLKLTLNFKESKSSPIVAVFLKDYLPCIFRKL